MAATTPLTLSEIRDLALKKVDRIAAAYWENGAGENRTVKENEASFNNHRIRPRVLRNVQDIDMSTTVLGDRLSLPVGIAPSGWHKMANPIGEAGTVAAAKAMGTCMGVSMGTSMGQVPVQVCSPEEIRSAGGSAVKFYQLYMFRNRDVVKQVLQRVEKLGYEAIMLTIDTPVVGRRLAEMRNRADMPGFLKVISFGSQLPGERKLSKDDVAIDSSLVWDEVIPWLRQTTTMQIWLKGIMTPEDALLAVKHRVDGIIVSNHGGRQLDACLSTIEVLPEIAAAVKGVIPVHLDGGIRRGTDIFQALALGADFVWIGRPALWGLAYDGQRGVEMVLEILREELKACMGVAGCASIGDIDASYVRRVNLTKL